MECKLTEFSLIQLLLLSFILFVRKNVFYRKNIQYAYNFYGTDLYPPVCKCMQRRIQNQSNIYRGTSLRKSQKSLDPWMGSKYVSGIDFTVQKVYRMSIFIWYSQSRLQKFVIAFLFLQLIKRMLV